MLYPQTAAALEELLERDVPGRSVLWLNELRHYADDPGGQRVLWRLSGLLLGRDQVIVITRWGRTTGPPTPITTAALVSRTRCTPPGPRCPT
ncbi:hypothetical protein [Actinomadura roseirufa]|uniref:hypothetical protein n=1 Tax=Actinomadura roseirufa TaxID=2094049 RepID=UPI0010415370|nr:hypothetical protein [Actinomadura roseirufa]